VKNFRIKISRYGIALNVSERAAQVSDQKPLSAAIFANGQRHFVVWRGRRVQNPTRRRPGESQHP
jgi:hypothetical protein